MTKYYEKSATRWYTKKLVKAWMKGEANLGLKNSFFIMDKGVVTQYIDTDEGEAFHKKLTEDLKKEVYFLEIVDKFFTAIKLEDKVKMFECLCIFDEIDNYPEIATPTILRGLRKVREATHEEIYKLR